MKFYTKLTHQFIALLHIEFLFLFLKKYLPFFIKFIPLPGNYKMEDFRTIKRDGVTFHTQPADYVQWQIFADLPDSAWKKAAESITNESCVIDIGANCGAFSLKVAQDAFTKKKANFKIYAFEPNPIVCNNLNKNLNLNSYLKKYISIHQIGLGDKSGDFWMNFSPVNSGGGRINCESNTGIQIEVITLDQFVLKENIQNISFIKIDVEGFEPFVIRGGKQTIEANLPIMYIEITEKWFNKLDTSRKEIMDYLENLSYTFFIEIDNTFIPISNNIQLSSIFQFNLLAIPQKSKFTT